MLGASRTFFIHNIMIDPKHHYVICLNPKDPSKRYLAFERFIDSFLFHFHVYGQFYHVATEQSFTVAELAEVISKTIEDGSPFFIATVNDYQSTPTQPDSENIQ